jgi:hypothetical protein
MKRITGVWQDPKGNLIAYGVLHAKLNQDATVISTGQAAPRNVEFQLDINGALRPGAQIWGNDELLPSGTYYTLVVTAYGGGVVWGPVLLALTGTSPINISAIVPVSTIPPSMPLELGPGSGSIEGIMLAGGSNVTLSVSGDGTNVTVSINAAGGGTAVGGTVAISGTNGIAVISSGASSFTIDGSLLSAQISSLSQSVVSLMAGGGTGTGTGTGTGGGGGTGAGIPFVGIGSVFASDQLSGNTSGGNVTALNLLAGSNISLSGVTNADPGGTQYNIVLNAASGGGGIGGQLSITGNSGLDVEVSTNSINTSPIGTTLGFTVPDPPAAAVAVVQGGNSGVLISTAADSAGTSVSLDAVMDPSLSTLVSLTNLTNLTSLTSATSLGGGSLIASGGGVTLSTDGTNTTISGNQAMWVNVLAYGGSVSTVSSYQQNGGNVNNLAIYAGNNITLGSQYSTQQVLANNFSSAMVYINAPGTVSLIAGSNVTLSSVSSVQGTWYTINAGGGDGEGGPVGGIWITGNDIATVNQIWLMSNRSVNLTGYTLSGDDNDENLTVSVQLGGFRLVPFAGGAGLFTATPSGASWNSLYPQAIWLYPGSNITMSGSFDPIIGQASLTLNAGGGIRSLIASAGLNILTDSADAYGNSTVRALVFPQFWMQNPQSVPPLGSTSGSFGSGAGVNGMYPNGLYIFAGQNIGLSAGTSTQAAGTATLLNALLTINAGSVAAMSFEPSEDIMLLPRTDSAGTTYQVGLAPALRNMLLRLRSL